jgi:hypothetical protein
METKHVCWPSNSVRLMCSDLVVVLVVSRRKKCGVSTKHSKRFLAFRSHEPAVGGTYRVAGQRCTLAGVCGFDGAPYRAVGALHRAGSVQARKSDNRTVSGAPSLFT